MNDQIETAETLAEEIPVTPKQFIVLGLATYGAVRLTTDVIGASKRIINNRKAKKAAEKSETTPEQ